MAHIPNSITNEQKKKIGFFLLLLGASWLSFLCFYGLDIQDSFFWLNLSTLPASKVSYLLIGNRPLIGFFRTITQDYVILLRGINLLLWLGSFSIVFFIKDIRENSNSLIFTGVLLLCFSFFYTNILGGDSFTSILVVSIFVLLYKYLKEPKATLILMISLFIVLATLVRLPNILCLPLSCAAIFVNSFVFGNQTKSSMIKHVLILLSVYFSCLIISYYLLLGYIPIIDSVKTTKVKDSSYSLKSLLVNYMQNGISILKYFSVVLVILFSLKVKDLINNKALKYFFTAGVILVVSIFAFYVTFNLHHRVLGLLFASVILGVSVHSLLEKRTSHFIFYIVLTFCFMFVGPAGSNTGLYKFVYLLPLTTLLFLHLPRRSKVYLAVAFICFIPATFIGKFTNIFGDSSFSNLTTTTSIEQLAYIKTTPDKKLKIESIYHNGLSHSKNKIGVSGLNGHLFTYLFNPKLQFVNFDQRIDSGVLEEFKNSDVDVLLHVYSRPLKDSVLNSLPADFKITKKPHHLEIRKVIK